MDKIIINRAFDDDINLVKMDKDYLVYGVSFDDDDEAFSFYYSLPDGLNYRIYKKEEYESIMEGTYHHRFNEYYDLCNFLNNEFNMNDSDINVFDDSCVLDYMFAYQLDPDTAKNNLNINLDKYFGKIEFNDKAFICSTIYKLAKNYPSFNFKGHCYNEINEKVR